MSSRIPARLSWAISVLEAQPSDRILEIGCGRGVALELLCNQLPGARITALDRSAVAISAARARLTEQVSSERVRLLHGSLANADLGESFDKIFAINVNVFWRDPRNELAVIRRVLAAVGRLYLFYEPPSRAQAARAEAECSRNLASNGFRVERVVRADLPPNPGLCLVATVA